MPTAVDSSGKRHRETQMQGLRAVNEGMRWLQETKEEETLTRALVTEPMLSSEALLQTKVSVDNQKHETSLMMKSHESTDQAPSKHRLPLKATLTLQISKFRLQILGNQMLPVSAGYHFRDEVTCQMNPRILWVHWVKGRVQIFRHALPENDWIWRLYS